MQTYPVLSNTSSEYETTVAAGITTTDMCGTMKRMVSQQT